MKKLLSLVIGILVLAVWSTPALAVDCEGEPPAGNPDALRQYQTDCERKISSLQSEAKTLKSAISLLSSKINLTLAQIRSTTAQIEALEKDIQTLGGVISDLNLTLDDLSEIYISRLRQAYKDRHRNPLVLLFASDSFTTFQNKVKYLAVASKRDQIILHELESTRIDLDGQKTEKEAKQAQVEGLKKTLESQKLTLDRQNLEKKRLLADTQNSEAKYQTLLAKAIAELQAIESIIAGQGSEVDAGEVSQNTKIATIIPGPSTCSNGAHLHFEVAQNKTHQNPASYLKNLSGGDVIWNNSPDGAFGFGGTWDWPINYPVKINQGYGMTYYASALRYYGGGPHTGIDMMGTDLEVKAVKSGQLYRGSIPCRGGTLKYVHVKHKDDGLDSYYLHVNYF